MSLSAFIYIAIWGFIFLLFLFLMGYTGALGQVIFQSMAGVLIIILYFFFGELIVKVIKEFMKASLLLKIKLITAVCIFSIPCAYAFGVAYFFIYLKWIE